MLNSRIIAVIISVFAICLSFCAGEKMPTPLEQADTDVLTSYADMTAYLQALHTEYQNFSMETAGSSTEGRDIFLLRFGTPADDSADKLKVLIFAQQHGNEPSGKEAALAFARDIAAGKYMAFLDNIELFLIPQVNPDGSEKRQRRNGADADLNREHLTLSQPEVRAVNHVFQAHMPEVTLDVHEYGIAGSAWVENGMHKNFGQQIGAVSNPNISMALRSYAWNSVIPGMKTALEPKNVMLQRYLVAGAPTERFRYSTAALNDGRNSLGIYNTLSFLIEGKNGLTVEDDIHERARQQLETMKAFLDYFSAHAEEVRDLVRIEREELTSGNLRPEVPLVMDYVKDPARPSVTVNVKNLETDTFEDRTFDNFFPLVNSSLSVLRPHAYIIPPEQEAVLDVLHRHTINVVELDEPLRCAVETYRIRGVSMTEREDKETLDVDVAVSRTITTIPAGHFIVRTNSIRTNLIVTLLEPQSQWGLAQLDEFSGLLKVGSTFPIIRLMRIVE